MTEDKIKVEELIEQVKASSGKDDVCIICYKDEEERCKELFPSKEIHVLPEKVRCNETNNAIFIIPTDAKPIKVVYEEKELLDIPPDIDIKGSIYTIY
jgi:hypothetical protein